jgi:hypothetical protein
LVLCPGHPDRRLPGLSAKRRQRPQARREGKQIWTAGYFVLRGSGDNRDAVCINPAGGGGFAQWQKSNANMVVNRCIGFRGGLIVVAVPKGSSWSVTLSDAPVVASPTDPPLSSAESAS